MTRQSVKAFDQNYEKDPKNGRLFEMVGGGDKNSYIYVTVYVVSNDM